MVKLCYQSVWLAYSRRTMKTYSQCKEYSKIDFDANDNVKRSDLANIIGLVIENSLIFTIALIITSLSIS